MTDSLNEYERDWLDKMKVTIATELTRLQSLGLPPMAQVERLFIIPEVQEAFEMRAKGRPKP